MSLQDFIPLARLGEGSFSSVYKVQRRSDQGIYALKKVKLGRLSARDRQNALNEVRLLYSLDSPHIIAYKEAFFDDRLSVLCLVMEFADGGDLLQLVEQHRRKRLPISEALIWTAVGQMLSALVTLHSQNILHRDLKSANVFRCGANFKLGDLNVSIVGKANLAQTQTGTPYYASPEVWRDEPYNGKSDVWSLGCVVYELATLRPPFAGNNLAELFQSVQHKEVTPLPSVYSDKLKAFVRMCLQKKTDERPSAQQLLNNALFADKFPQNLIQTFKQSLIRTIKLPTDLKELKENLPSSKYVSDRPANPPLPPNDQLDLGPQSQRNPTRSLAHPPKANAYLGKGLAPVSMLNLREPEEVVVRERVHTMEAKGQPSNQVYLSPTQRRGLYRPRTDGKERSGDRQRPQTELKASLDYRKNEPEWLSDRKKPLISHSIAHLELKKQIEALIHHKQNITDKHVEKRAESAKNIFLKEPVKRQRDQS